jgi:hypothetical protein
MINVDDLDEMDNQMMDERVEKYRQKVIKRQESMRENREKNRLEAEAAQKSAEHKFPLVLKNIEKKINSANKRKLRKVTHYFGDGLEGMFLMVMIFQTLPLSGFLLTPYTNRSIEIRW